MPYVPVSAVKAVGSSLASYAKLYELQANGVSAGSSASGWQQRVLNTEIDTDGIVSLSSNQMTFQAGTYDSLIFVPQVNSDGATARLRNVTDGATVIVGMDTYSTGTLGMGNSTPIVGRFTIAAGKALEIQSYITSAAATFGLGIDNSFGVGEVYTVAEFWKVA